ncbi:hypothetical protein NQ318_022738 [Aromia moschata]|uniref:rRNA biogenesis protein RRP36 n=1 Tax=Aromia moschata TaxID=1265417 RepID=A0AAV8YEE7_9CUCU|nr:hypothetical protein NQ318_022738 [Aromia moschata]
MSDGREHIPDIFEERAVIREKISTLSFEDLLKMKEDLGSKLYNETIFGPSKKIKQTGLKRENKNRPREISSKIRRKQIGKELNTKDIAVVKKVLPRDPRFDPLCGQYDDNIFKRNYKFVNDIRKDEKKQLEKELKSCTNTERKKTIKFLIQRIDNQIREEIKRDAEHGKKFEEKQNIRDQLKKGEKPVFKKKSVKKLEGLIERFEELKKTNKLRKHIERKSKKLTSRDRKKILNEDLRRLKRDGFVT